jgi:hypothetical protein
MPPAGLPARRRAHLVGGGIGSLAAAAFMVRDSGMDGDRITIYDDHAVPGGSLDAGGDASGGYRLRGGRMFTTDNYECTWALFRSIQSLATPGLTVYDETVAFNTLHRSHAQARFVDRNHAVGDHRMPVSAILRDEFLVSELDDLRVPALAQRDRIQTLSHHTAPAAFRSPTGFGDGVLGLRLASRQDRRLRRQADGRLLRRGDPAGAVRAPRAGPRLLRRRYMPALPAALHHQHVHAPPEAGSAASNAASFEKSRLRQPVRGDRRRCRLHGRILDPGGADRGLRPFESSERHSPRCCATIATRRSCWRQLSRHFADPPGRRRTKPDSPCDGGQAAPIDRPCRDRASRRRASCC